MLKRLTTLIVAVAATAFAAAQAKLDPFDAHCADIVILQAKPIQKELGVTEAQRAKMNQHAAWHQGQLKDIDAQIKAKKLDANGKAVRDRLDKTFSELKVRVLTALTPSQVRRLRELSLQRVGDAAMCDPVVAKKIGMTDAQLKKMQATYKEGSRKFSEIEQQTAQKVLLPYKDKKVKDKAEAERLNNEIKAKLTAAGAKVKPQLDAIRAEYGKRMKAILTSSQVKAYAALRGKPYRPS